MSTSPQGAFRALADPTRRQILMHLSLGDMTIAEVSDHFDMTRAAVKKHLTVLKEGSLISVHPKGRERINRLEPEGLKTAADWFTYFDRFWDKNLNKLHTAIENEQMAQKDTSNE